MDHYKVLGLKKTATKEEIKAAFKKLALQCHPDKHTQSPKYIQDNAKLRFKQVSEAYGFLMDDRKHAKYNYRSHAGGGDKTRSSGFNGGGGTGGSGGGFGDKFGAAIRNLTTRSSLLNLGYAAAILGWVAVTYSSRESWKMPDPEEEFGYQENYRESRESPTFGVNYRRNLDIDGEDDL